MARSLFGRVRLFGRLRGLLSLAALGLLAGCADGAQPVACGIHPVGVVPLEMQGGVPVALVQVNGVPLRLILDTGAQVTAVAPAAAERAHLPIDPHIALLTGIGGTSRRHFVRFDAAQAGDLKFRPFIGAMGDFTTAMLGGQALDGLLGVDVLGAYDIDFDLAARRATFYGGRLCDPAEIPWGLPVRSVEAYRHSADYDGRFYMPLTVNGQALTALVDTGAGVSGMSVGAAVRVPPPQQPMVFRNPIRLNGLGTRVVTVQAQRFGTMVVGGETFPNPEFIIHEDLPAEVLLGDNYLGHRRVWFSFSSGRVFTATPGPRRIPPLPPGV